MPLFVDLTHDDDDSMQSNVIDLTRSPSPPPQLPPKTPFCIGQLTITALVLYPLPYLAQGPTFPDEWAPVRLQHEHNPSKPGGSETIHIISPNVRVPAGDVIQGEVFGVVEQKVATSLGPMMSKGLIRLEAKVQRGGVNSPILPLRILVCTPKGNIPVVGNYLHQCGLLLDNPTPPWDYQCLSSYHYHNPHNPPPGGYNRTIFAPNRLAGPSTNDGRWSTPSTSSKSVEVQRSQVEEVFKSLRDGDELAETEPSLDIATTLYPHQKKALTFLLEREREISGPDGSYSSLWQPRTNPWSHQTTWFHVITQKETFEEPVEAKGAILADDMGLGKTITCVSLIAATLDSANTFASEAVDPLPPPPDTLSHQEHGGTQNAYEVAKGKAKAARAQEKFEAEYTRASRIKVKSRASLIVCPLSTVSNWEDQFREHWKGEVSVVGGGGGGSCTSAPTPSPPKTAEVPLAPRKTLIRQGTPLRIYIYHGNARRPDPTFLADFDAVITTYATLASEFSKQNRCLAGAEEEEEGVSSDGVTLLEVDGYGNQIAKPPKPKKNALKRKKSGMPGAGNTLDLTSPLQSVHWFRVVLDEAHSIKETGTVGSRASCDLMADRRLCLTGTPVQNKLDDVFALIKFLRLRPFDDKNTWTEFIGTPVKFGQDIGIARLQMIMKCITLRRTKETRAEDGKAILALPPRRDELRFLQFDPQEQEIYNQYFQESKAEFTDLSSKNEVMKNYVGILQKILRLRQICDHFELVKAKEVEQDTAASYESIVADITNQGLTQSRACAIFALLRESATTQCVECGSELCISTETGQSDDLDGSGPPASKRGRKTKAASRTPTRASSPAGPRPILTRCQHLFCIMCYRNCVCPAWPNVTSDELRACSACQMALSATDAVEVRSETSPETLKKKTQKREKRQKGASLDNYHPSTKVRALMQDLMQFSTANPYSANYDPSTLDIQIVNDEKSCPEDNIVKTVVFSQWTSMLDKVEDALEAAKIRYDRLDGTMRRDERVRAMDALKHDPQCEVLLVSLKAGGVGLNLTAAQRVYLMDPYWNPAVENQAVDRIHRLGQTKPVTTVKLVIENTIEARLLEVQRQKTELANMTLGQNLSKAELMQRRMEELAKLFGS